MEISIPAKRYLDFLTNNQPVIRILCQQLMIYIENLYLKFADNRY